MTTDRKRMTVCKCGLWSVVYGQTSNNLQTCDHDAHDCGGDPKSLKPGDLVFEENNRQQYGHDR